MATTNRASLLNKTHKVLRKHYQPYALPERPLLEELLFACCLENAHYATAERAYNTLQGNLFDWNEVRVSTVRELAEVLNMLPEPELAADRLKRILQGVFDKHYAFELEDLRKQNLGKAVKYLESIGGSTPFNVAHVTQTILGGHAIPLDRGAIEALLVVGAVSPAEASKNLFGAIERAIPKNKGREFASLLHQLGADFIANPHAANLHKVLLEITPDAKSRLPRRQVPKTAGEDGEARDAGEPASKKSAKESSGKKAAAKKSGKSKDTKPEPKPAEPKAKARPPAKKESKPQAKKKPATSKKPR